MRADTGEEQLDHTKAEEEQRTKEVRHHEMEGNEPQSHTVNTGCTQTLDAHERGIRNESDTKKELIQ